mmetsp:Transcript_35382/g.84529  ORF Transcript_35382/g.84529 Transcript_35382/m.84529 type:complete len:326 (-) Transcript_35382:17-994(-)
MLPLIMLLWCWTGYLIGFVTVTFVATHPSVAVSPAEEALDDTTYLDPALFEKALIHAKEMAVTNDPQYKQHRKEHQKLLDQLQEGNIDALYEVAGSLNRRNSEDDRITSVQLWHALADGPSAHVPSAMALGFSYAEVDKELALQYFVQASAGKEGGGPNQAALFNAGRLFLELNDAASSLAHIRGCATLGEKYPEYASEQLSETCREAYGTLSMQLQLETTIPPGIEDAISLFLYASIDDYPQENTREYATWNRGMEQLQFYATMVRETTAVGKVGRSNLIEAAKELELLQSQSAGKMSDLQRYLLKIITGRIQVLLTGMENDEL